MKRFLAFSGDTWYPSGGMRDFVGEFETHDDAIMHCLELKNDWYHIYDCENMTIVDKFGDMYSTPWATISKVFK